MTDDPREEAPRTDFAQEAEHGSQGMVRELFYFLKTSKKWWLTPIILALVLLGILVVASGSFAAPFIYTLF